MQTKYIKVDRVQTHQALQDFAIAIQESVREGFVVSDDSKHHARELGFGQFDITLVKDGHVVEGRGAELTNLNFVQTMPVPPQPETTITTSISQNPIIAHLDSCKNKQELLDFAKRYSITIPEDKQVVTAIKKYLREQFVAKIA